MNPLTVAIVTFLLVVGVTLVSAMIVMRLWPAIGRQRLSGASAVADGPVSILRFQSESQSGLQRAIEKIGRNVVPKDNVRLTRYRVRLTQAGFSDPRGVAMLWGAKVVCALIGFLAYPFFGFLVQRVLSNTLIISLVCLAIGFMLPDFWLYNRIKERQRAIVNMLPDVLDLLMVCVEAGLGFDAAVARVAEQEELTRSPFHQELMRMHLEVRAGRPREEALRSLGERCGVQEVRSMVSAFVQSDRLGTPLGKTLRVHAETARIQRRHRAEERASLAPLKMIFPTVLFLMPAFFLVAMAPSLIGLIKSFRSLVQ
ncbi:MAG TPA: type II secretion system F family protein [Methylomirabilota bacterium]|nr:type II secretion system F family protein [Methylomirabilota bacterium]